MPPSLPPPTGRPMPGASADPVEEQRRRRAIDRWERRRRRRPWKIGLAVVVAAVVAVVGAIGAFFVLRGEGSTGETRSDPVGASAAPPTTLGSPPTSAPVVAVPPTVAPQTLVAVDEVWLLDRGDEVYDWGLNVVVPAGAPTRDGVEVVVRMLDADDSVVAEATRTLDGVGEGEPSTVAGRLVSPRAAPVRLEFDLTVGVPSNERPLGSMLAIRALRRDGDEISGRIRSFAPDDVRDVTMFLVWRADDSDSASTGGSEIVASIPFPVELIRAGVDARFRLDLSDQRVPSGPPDDVLWVRSG